MKKIGKTCFNSENSHQKTALMIAAKNENYKTVELLIKNNAAVNEKSK